MHITLLGDSIFANRAYVKGGKDVVSHLRGMTDKATLCAKDGAVVDDVERQLPKIPKTATHLFLSVGGNDALFASSILDAPLDDVFVRLANVGESFEARYEEMLRGIFFVTDLPLTVCTIYYPRFKNKIYQRLAKAALSTFNDVILRQAFYYGLPVIDLRLLCNRGVHYANAIEPSVKGGLVIAQKIVEVADSHNFDDDKSVVYV